jgi:hypothetical protein
VSHPSGFKFCFCLFFQDRKGLHYVAQVVFKFSILLPLFPQCWDYSMLSRLALVCNMKVGGGRERALGLIAAFFLQS